MRSKLVFLVLMLGLSGCCNCIEKYAPFLEQIEENLREDIRPKYERALKQSNRPADLVENDLGLVDDTADSIRRVVTGGIEVWSE